MAKKKRKKTPPYTQMTMEWLREDLHLTVDKVEHWTQGPAFMKGVFARKRRDLYGVIDLVAMPKMRKIRAKIPIVGSIMPCTIGVQSTSYMNVGAHIQKCMLEKRLLDWVALGNAFWIIGWQKIQVGNRERWRPDVHVCSIVWKSDKPSLRVNSVSYFPKQEIGRGG